MIKMFKHQSGFSLIELMIVVSIIGILSAIAIPSYQDFIIKIKASEGLVLASPYKVGLAEALQGGGAATAQYITVFNAQIGSPVSKYVFNLEANATGVLTITFHNISPLVDESTLLLTPFTVTNGAYAVIDTNDVPEYQSVDWACTSDSNQNATQRGMDAAGLGTLPSRYAAAECK